MQEQHRLEYRQTDARLLKGMRAFVVLLSQQKSLILHAWKGHVLSSGGLTSRIGAGSKQKAESGTEKVGRKQRASAAPKPERKQKAEPASGTQKIKGSQPKGNLLGFLGGRKDANTVRNCSAQLAWSWPPDGVSGSSA